MADLLLTGGVSVSVMQEDVSTPNNFVGAYFDIIQSHSVSIQNQITDNYLENNTAIQDHIAHAPITVSLSGISAEVVYESPTGIIDAVYKGVNKFIGKKFTHSLPKQGLYTDKLIALSALYPPVDNVTQMAKNAVQYVESSVNRYKTIINNLTGKPRQTRLIKIYTDLIALRNADVALVVETPFTTFENMYIQSVSLSQGNQDYVADIQLTLKQINFATTEVTQADKNVLSQYTRYAKASVENHGNVQGKTVDNATLLKGWTNKVGLTDTGSGIRR